MPQGEQLKPPAPSWRQGSVIGHELIAPISQALGLSEELHKDSLLILISQDCDVVQDSYDAEPFIEFLIANPKPLLDEDKGLQFGKHPRKLQFKIIQTEGSQLFEINIHDRHRTRREVLLDGLPPLQLDRDLTALIARWIAKKYTRAAFPDEFNRRCRAAREKLGDLFKKRGDLITGVYIRLEPEDIELAKGEDYHVIVFASCYREVWEDQGSRVLAIKLVAKVQAGLTECDGVIVDDAALVPEHKFTLEDIRKSDRWDYDYLTYRSGGNNPISPTE